MSTDNNTRQQTPPDILKQHLSVSEGVWGCLLASVVVCWHLDFPGDVLRCLGDVWGISGGCMWVFQWYSWKSEMFGCDFGVSGFSILAVWSCNATLAQPWKAQLFLPDHTETSKYQNVYIRLKKMVEFCNLLIFWCPSERNDKIQLYYITLYHRPLLKGK